MREHTTLVVAHRPSIIIEATIVDTILVRCIVARAVERGNHQQLLAKGRYWQMYQLPQLAGEEPAASVEEGSLSA